MFITGKIRMIWLPNVEESMIICSAVQIQYWSVTDIRKMDGHTDRQTDRIAMSIARLSTAVLTRDKKGRVLDMV